MKEPYPNYEYWYFSLYQYSSAEGASENWRFAKKKPDFFYQITNPTWKKVDASKNVSRAPTLKFKTPDEKVGRICDCATAKVKPRDR